MAAGWVGQGGEVDVVAEQRRHEDHDDQRPPERSQQRQRLPRLVLVGRGLGREPHPPSRDGAVEHGDQHPPPHLGPVPGDEGDDHHRAHRQDVRPHPTAQGGLRTDVAQPALLDEHELGQHGQRGDDRRHAPELGEEVEAPLSPALPVDPGVAGEEQPPRREHHREDADEQPADVAAPHARHDEAEQEDGERERRPPSAQREHRERSEDRPQQGSHQAERPQLQRANSARHPTNTVRIPRAVTFFSPHLSESDRLVASHWSMPAASVAGRASPVGLSSWARSNSTAAISTWRRQRSKVRVTSGTGEPGATEASSSRTCSITASVQRPSAAATIAGLHGCTDPSTRSGPVQMPWIEAARS